MGYKFKSIIKLLFMKNLFLSIKENKRFFILLSVIIFVFFLICDLAIGGVISDFRGSLFTIGFEGPDMIHVLPFITIEYSSNLPLWNAEIQSTNPRMYRILFFSGLSSRSLELMYYRPLVIILYLMNTIIISLIISYLITLIYAKIQTGPQETQKRNN